MQKPEASTISSVVARGLGKAKELTLRGQFTSIEEGF